MQAVVPGQSAGRQAAETRERTRGGTNGGGACGAFRTGERWSGPDHRVRTAVVRIRQIRGPSALILPRARRCTACGPPLPSRGQTRGVAACREARFVSCSNGVGVRGLRLRWIAEAAFGTVCKPHDVLTEAVKDQRGCGDGVQRIHRRHHVLHGQHEQPWQRQTEQ